MTDKEVMQQALDMLYENTNYSMRGDPIACQDERNDATILLIQDVLSQPEQPADDIALQELTCLIRHHTDPEAFQEIRLALQSFVAIEQSIKNKA